MHASLSRGLERIEQAYLVNKHVGAKVLERELELLEAIVDRDLDGNGSIGTGAVARVMAWIRHDGLCWVGSVRSVDRWMCGTRAELHRSGGDVFKVVGSAAGVGDSAPFL